MKYRYRGYWSLVPTTGKRVYFTRYELDPFRVLIR